MTNVFAHSLNILKERIGDMEINANTIIKVLQFSMEVVEATQLKGEAQKTLVEKLVRQVVIDAPISDDKEKLLLDMVDNGIVGNMADLVVSTSKGEVDINSAVKVASTCCVSFFKRRR
tara:strand:+ start:92 stop:445 length:354 start_codon:yes stop_codon:yes gene_type:complete